MTWRNLHAEELEVQFNPRRAVPDFEAYQAANAARSAEIRARLEARLDLAYGDGPLQTLDVFPAAAAAGGGAAPVHVFFHGGYWRAQDKANFAFVAEHLVAQGICTVVANYDLCPAVTLDGVVAAARRAIAWTFAHAGEFGADPARLTLSGSSAGAHLQAMALAHDWPGEGLPADLIKGAVPITGIYDPEPARHVSVNAETPVMSCPVTYWVRSTMCAPISPRAPDPALSRWSRHTSGNCGSTIQSCRYTARTWRIVPSRPAATSWRRYATAGTRR